MMTQDELNRLRRQATAPADHVFPRGVIGAPCQRCGARGIQETSKGCLEPSSLTVDRVALLQLLEMAESYLDQKDATSAEAARADWHTGRADAYEDILRDFLNDYGGDACKASLTAQKRALELFGAERKPWDRSEEEETGP